jgi:hypothetical protein
MIQRAIEYSCATLRLHNIVQMYSKRCSHIAKPIFEYAKSYLAKIRFKSDALPNLIELLQITVKIFMRSNRLKIHQFKFFADCVSQQVKLSLAAKFINIQG